MRYTTTRAGLFSRPSTSGRFLAVLCLTLVPALASAQGPTSSPQISSIREHVEVVATRVPEAPDDVPVAIEVISGDELRDRGITDLRAALALATGVDVAPGGDGGPASFVPEFWGLKEFDAFLLVVDDVPWGGAFNPALSTLDLHDLERIEILRGPAPVMFGATSFVGVIHVVHRNASIASRDLSARLGSFGSGAGSAAIAVSLGDWQSRVSVDGERQGFSDDRTSFRRGHVSWRSNQSSTSGRTLVCRRRHAAQPESGESARTRWERVDGRRRPSTRITTPAVPS